MRLANKRQQMVFAQRVQLDVPDDDHLIVVRFEQRAVDDLFEGLLIAVTQVLHGFRRALWRVHQAFAFWIFTHATENCPVVFRQFFIHQSTLLLWVKKWVRSACALLDPLNTRLLNSAARFSNGGRPPFG
ncbi:hypothetical protein D3C84_918150 [compost metagenome]